MDDKIIATFCLCDDLLKAMHHQENRQCQMNDAEILTTAFTAALFFRGNHESARAMLKQHGYIPGVYPSWGRDGIAAEMRYAFGVIRHVLQKRSLPDAMPDGQHTSG